MRELVQCDAQGTFLQAILQSQLLLVLGSQYCFLMSGKCLEKLEPVTQGYGADEIVQCQRRRPINGMAGSIICTDGFSELGGFGAGLGGQANNE